MANKEYSFDKAQNAVLSCFSSKTVDAFAVERPLKNQSKNIRLSKDANFGPHYMITVKDIDMSMEFIFSWLDKIAPQINMDAISRPYVIKSTVNNYKYISGILIVAQSHVAIHYNVDARIAYLDIFSCSFLDNSQIESVLKESFGVKYDCKYITRGCKYSCTTNRIEEKLLKYKKWQNDRIS